MAPAATAVFEFPQLHGTTLRLCENTVFDVGEDNAVDGPHSVSVIQPTSLESVTVG
jgi:hypothetical protein